MKLEQKNQAIPHIFIFCARFDKYTIYFRIDYGTRYNSWPAKLKLNTYFFKKKTEKAVWS